MDAEIKKIAVPVVKTWSNEELVDLIKKQLETDINLDFLLDLRTKELTQLVACIRERIGKLQRHSAYCKQVFKI